MRETAVVVRSRSSSSSSRDVRRRSRSPREGAVQVSEVQRARIMGAMVRVVAERGVGATTVSRVVKHASVSRRTFYELFSGCEDCFLAVFDEAVERASRIASDAAADTAVAVASPRGMWREQVRAGLGALLGFFEEEPALGRLLVVDALGAGPRVLESRAGVLETLAGIVDRGRDEGKRGRGKTASSSSSFSSPSSASPPLTAEGTVGAVLAVIHARMTQPEDPRPLTALLNSLMGMIVLPYLGRAAAAKELARPVPERPRGGASAAPRVARGARNGSRGGAPPDPLEGLDMRLTYRTLMVLSVIAAEPGASNRRVGEGAGIQDQGQISKLLGRLGKLGLIENSGAGQPKGESNSWTLTGRGQEVQRALDTER
jgi:AcrR family transcriptional regulator